MTELNLRRWEPSSGLPEIPIGIFEYSYSFGRVDFRGFFTSFGGFFPHLEAAPRGVEIRFENVVATAAFDDFNDPILKRSPGIMLAAPVPYGGCWPFAEVLNSPWAADIADEDGIWQPEEFRHFLVIAMEHSLHVVTLGHDEPSFIGLIARDD